MNKILLIVGGVVVIAVILVVVFGMQQGGSDGLMPVSLPGKTLNLSNQGLAKIPGDVFGRGSLEELNVSYNELSGSIPSQIGQLKNLRILNASHNNMTGVPAEIGQLRNLEVLNLSYNQLTGLPNELGNLKNLKTLDLRGNQYSTQDLDGIRANLPSTVQILVD